MSTSRRTFLTTAAAGVAAVGIGLGAATATADVGIQSGQQPEWRCCLKCFGMFYSGIAIKGRCPAGGSHQAGALNFNLPYELAPSQSAQIDWRFCQKCYGMFYGGIPNERGYCPAGGPHLAEGYIFTLPHDYLQVPPHSQRDWAFCLDCWGLFYHGVQDNKGVCPVPGPHVKPSVGSYDFMLPFLW